MAVLDQLEPKKMFHFFEEICQIPHGTFDIGRISDFLTDFAKKRNLEVIQDKTGNVVIKKPGTAGYENSAPVILQGHMDMVCDKRPESVHDFKKDPLKLRIVDGSVMATDTTLGADNGIAVAIGMALLDSDDIPHPPLEVLFTADEEIGMGGATAIDMSLFKGRMLINLDSEDEGIFTAGCAGGINFYNQIPVKKQQADGTAVTIRVHDLLGGHSGIEIDQQRGNANKMMGRLLNRIERDVDFVIAEINGGSKANVIAFDCTARLIVQPEDAAKVKDFAEDMKETWAAEFMGDEPTMKVDVAVEDHVSAMSFDKDSTGRVISYLIVSPDGVIEYNRKIKGSVETSLNIGILETAEDYVRASYQIRSSLESKKVQIREQLEQCAKVVNGESVITGEYPAWQYNPESKLRTIMVETFQDMYAKEPEVVTIHAGLECGLFLGKCPELDCVSIGCDLKNVHSFNESVDIASAARTWDFVKEVLARLK